MKNKLTLGLACCLTAGVFATGVLAGVPASQVARLGNDLTPMGSERAGDGGIPAWTGGLSDVPSNVSYQIDKQLPNPFSSDPIQFTITGANMAQYAQHLTEGYKALLDLYPSYKMNVYQSRRSCAYPEAVYGATRTNAEVGRLGNGGNGITGAINGFPFPIPNTALEIVWNHTLRYRSYKVIRQTANAAVTRGGDFVEQISQQDAVLRWSDPQMTSAADLDNISIYFIANTVAPARAAGSVILVHETLDATVGARKAWQYSPGTRRVRRAPNIAYDNPGFNSDGLSTTDSFDGYNGTPNRYDWTVIGKSAKFIAENSYDSTLVSYDEFISPLHLNQDVLRYELRRVWTIEANLRPDTRHVYGRRVMHMNEDSWTLMGAENYDGRGELWRVQEEHGMQHYHVPLCNKAAEIVYDLQAGRYLALTMINEEPTTNYFADELDDDHYTPSAIRQMGTR